jgi:hypothetical protein
LQNSNQFLRVSTQRKQNYTEITQAIAHSPPRRAVTSSNHAPRTAVSLNSHLSGRHARACEKHDNAQTRKMMIAKSDNARETEPIFQALCDTQQPWSLIKSLGVRMLLARVHHGLLDSAARN